MQNILSLKFAKLHGPTFIIVAAILWALDGVLRRSLFSLQPLTIVFYEHLIGSLILLPLVWRSVTSIKLTKQSILLICGIALLSGLLGTLWFTTALTKINFIPFSVVFLLQKLQPLFAATTAAIFLKEKISGRYLAWAGVALAAGYFVTFPGGVVNTATGAATTIAALYALGAAAAWGSSTTFSKMLLNTYSTQVSTALRFFTTTAFAFVAVVLFQDVSQLFVVSGSQLLRFTTIALSTGMIALYLYYKGLQFTEARVSTILELTFPVLAVAIDAFVYKSMLTPGQIIAAVILFYAMSRTAKLNRA